MKLYITGATGFVGSYVVAEALARGHEVVAVVRPSSGSALGTDEGSGVTAARVDLRSRQGLADCLAGVDAVIHLAAAKSGDFHTQFAGTVVATENLLTAMTQTGVDHLVGISTFSVYDYRAIAAGSILTESSPIDRSPQRRDEYAQTKLLQEDLYRRFGEQSGTRTMIIRPGMIYGRDNLWHALLGAELGPRFLKVGSKAILPMTYVENCAEAIVLGAQRLADEPESVDGEIINIVDDELPTQAEYVDLVSTVIEPPPSIQVPWPAMRLAADLLDKANSVLLDGRAKFPGIVVPDRLHGRFKPLRYSNAKAARLLGWKPRFSTAEAVQRSVERNGQDVRIASDA